MLGGNVIENIAVETKYAPLFLSICTVIFSESDDKIYVKQVISSGCIPDIEKTLKVVSADSIINGEVKKTYNINIAISMGKIHLKFNTKCKIVNNQIVDVLTEVIEV